MTVLGIESSCDETSASVVNDGKVLSNVISSQLVHKKYGGIVPELASRAHQRLVVPVVEEALANAGVVKTDIEGVAVTCKPGLIGALMVGVNFGKAFAYGRNIPLIGVNHLEAHVYSTFIDDPKPSYPLICLLVSGGHTQLILLKDQFEHQLLGGTRDDAAGEAFDKGAKMLGLGFPGGPMIDKIAASGNPKFVDFPRSYLNSEGFDFSFSGVKTSLLYWLRDHGHLHAEGVSDGLAANLAADLCASYQAAVVDVLVEKTLRAVGRFGVENVAVAGGVSANSSLRERLKHQSSFKGFKLFIPKFEYCTDNGAMIAFLGWMKLQAGHRSDLALSPEANASVA
jgi:N6-L-threonylcarbamoyladenine synthase